MQIKTATLSVLPLGSVLVFGHHTPQHTAKQELIEKVKKPKPNHKDVKDFIALFNQENAEEPYQILNVGSKPLIESLIEAVELRN